jgi:hypothetical protein
MRRPQFSLKTLLWLVVVVAAFFGGSEWQKLAMKRKMLDLIIKHVKELRAEWRPRNST